MLPFKLVYSEGYRLPIGSHVFPAEKYERIHQRLIVSGVAGPGDVLAPQAASDEDVLLVHAPQYVCKLRTGSLSRREELQLEMPYSPELVRAFWLAAGGSILAAERALQDGVAFNLGGGFHHAFADHGEGFCLIHDVAIAIRRLQRDGAIRGAMTVDCDVHHGNGTASIFGAAQLGVPSVFTLSLHQQNNYPAWKPPSSLDVDLPDGVGDDEYLERLEEALRTALARCEPDLICYVAGADPYYEDQLGGLGLTLDGLTRRDRLVFGVARARRIPVMVTLAGGYARNVEDTVTIHCNTVVAAAEIFSRA
ncbi:MAG: histone deacetylase [Vulcanimicrobiaceae bacterium]